MSETQQHRHIEIDPGLAPLLMHLDLSVEARLLYVARQLDTEQNDGRGILAVDALWSALPSFRITYSRRQFDDILKAGHGKLWRHSHGRLHLVGYVRLWDKLTSRVDPAIAQECRPQDRVLLSVAGTVGEFRARLYAAWIETRNNKAAITMSRDLLTRIWGVSSVTLRAWESAAGVSVIENRAQYAGRDRSVIPAHAYPYASTSGEIRTRWRLSNTYTNSQTLTLNHRLGQRRKARAARANALQVSQRVAICDDAHVPTGRLYFDQKEAADNWKACRRHLKKHGDWRERNHYIHLGHMVTRRGVMQMYECFDNNTGLLLTALDDNDREGQQSAAYRELAALASDVGASSLSGMGWRKTFDTICEYTHTSTRPSANHLVDSAHMVVRSSGTAAIVRGHYLRHKLNRMQQTKHGRKLSFKRIAELSNLLDAGQYDLVEAGLCSAIGN